MPNRTITIWDDEGVPHVVFMADGLVKEIQPAPKPTALGRWCLAWILYDRLPKPRKATADNAE